MPGRTPACVAYVIGDAVFVGDTLLMCHDYLPEGRAHYAWKSSVADERRHNIHVHDGIDKESFVTMRTTRDATLNVPVLILPSVQVNTCTVAQHSLLGRKIFPAPPVGNLKNRARISAAFATSEVLWDARFRDFPCKFLPASREFVPKTGSPSTGSRTKQSVKHAPSGGPSPIKRQNWRSSGRFRMGVNCDCSQRLPRLAQHSDAKTPRRRPRNPDCNEVVAGHRPRASAGLPVASDDPGGLNLVSGPAR